MVLLIPTEPITPSLIFQLHNHPSAFFEANGGKAVVDGDGFPLLRGGDHIGREFQLKGIAGS